MLNSGLTSVEAETRLETYGPNDVQARTNGFVRTYVAPLYSPISLMLIAAAVLSRLNGRIFDFYFILTLYIVNYSIQKWQEFKADRAIKELQKQLSFDVSTLRDGTWTFVSAKQLVPGDRIRLGLGSIIPADAIVYDAKNLSVNEAVLTGESMPKQKSVDDTVYSGAFITTGSLEASVTATGRHTTFGKTIFSIEQPSEKSILERDILRISRFLTAVSIVAVVILSVVFSLRGVVIEDLLTLDLSLIIAGIPIALPAVMAIILSIGAGELAKKSAIVRRLSALQDLSNVNLLLTDKTGTLTKNEISVANVLSYDRRFSTNEIVELASYAVDSETPDAIDKAILKKRDETGHPIPQVQIEQFIPYDSERKRSTVHLERGAERMLVSLGAPQVIRGLCHFESPETTRKFDDDIAHAASEGYRVLSLAIGYGSLTEERLQPAGLLYLADPLDENSRETVHFLRDNGIDVKMLTGDNVVIAERIARQLDLNGRVLSANDTQQLLSVTPDDPESDPLGEKAAGTIAAFAEILPKEKYEIVQLFKTGHVVAATGDGINDLPALKAAHVGIAVAGAVSALKSLADIVLLGRGLGVIRDAIIESRKIFIRLYNYSVYRISESFRLIITILILGIWYGSYPLEPLQLLLLAFLNDIPIVSLAVDRVKISRRPSTIHNRERLILSLLFGSIGVLNSVILFVLMTQVWHFSVPIVQTMFFLKLTVSGHALIFVAHTKERWYRYLPSTQVIWATVGTQCVATLLAVTGFLMPASISPVLAGFVWLWVLFWMQMSELMKDLQSVILGGSRDHAEHVMYTV